ncbi:MAG: arsenite efflux transporter metallochaperone ArsD [Vicinamibacterales bacterium]
MTAIHVFDPAMCCSSGVCGPSVDPQLARFSSDLDWIKTQGVSVERFNLAQQPAAFAEDQSVRSALETKGEAGLPVVKVNGEIKSSGVYPSRAELSSWAGLGGPAGQPIPTPPARSSAPILLKTTSGGCCTPAVSQDGDERPLTKSGSCC